MEDSKKWALKQLTKEQAIAFANSKEYENWTHDQIVRFQLFQRLMCMPFDKFHEAIEAVLDRPVFTHEFADSDSLKREYLGDKQAPTMEEIITMIPAEKRIIIGV